LHQCVLLTVRHDSVRKAWGCRLSGVPINGLPACMLCNQANAPRYPQMPTSCHIITSWASRTTTAAPALPLHTLLCTAALPRIAFAG
jgi:hypothetical protein